MLFKKKNSQINPHFIESLYKTHRDRLYWIAYNILKDRDSSEDVVQETFERVMKNILRLNLETPQRVAALLTVICRNAALDVLRKRKGEEITPLYDNDINFSEDTYNPEKLLISKESYQSVMDIVDGLDEKYRSVILLASGHGLSVEMVAKLLDISFETAKKRLYRARKHIKEEVSRIETNQTLDKIL